MMNLTQLVASSLNQEPLLVDDAVYERLAEDYQLMQQILKSERSTYGFNTLVGHKDNEKIDSDSYLNQLLKSHLIGFGEKFSKKEARFIINAKLCSWMAGGTGVSLETFKKLHSNSVDLNFDPAIPKNCSYSSGDVIPATHLLQDFIDLNNYQDFANTDIMPFINGNFVQVGYAASLIDTINKFWHLFIYGSLVSSLCFDANNSNYHLNFNASELNNRLLSLFKGINPNDKDTQDIITIRSLPQQLESFIKSSQSYFQVLDDYIAKPSGNPLFDSELCDSISQASFLALDLTDSVLSMINSVKLFMVASINRTTYMLSGKLPHIPADCSLSPNDLGLIQIPKLMMAIEERVSLSLPPASVYSAKSTSNGIEDLWNNGLICIDALEKILNEAINVLMIELYVQSYVSSNIECIAVRIHKLHSTLNLNSVIFSDDYAADSRPSLEEFMNLVGTEYKKIIVNDFFQKNTLLHY